ncbi:MAG TPA: prepilin-type N-terminal cleavage/methylation domain-containing protein, partial [Vicinamibacteria bacterium]|nr:prepilin-type N-terminal cleavage/methylation domain-containing protein [Vicinamibacteria bacterium]
MTDTRRGTFGRGAEAGFTLVEALVAIVVLIFGLMAVTNLMLVAASSNSVANQGTAAVTSSIRVMDMIKATSFNQLTEGGSDFDATDAGGAKACSATDLVIGTDWHCNDEVPGVGSIHTHWRIQFGEPVDPRLFHVRVHSEG